MIQIALQSYVISLHGINSNNQNTINLILFKDLEGIQKQDLPRHTINTLQVYGQEKYLVLQVNQE